MNRFTAKDVRVAAGMEHQKATFDRWINTGIARPSHPSPGSGHPAEWDGISVLALEVTRRLGSANINLKHAAAIAELATKDAWSDLLSGGWKVLIDLETLEFTSATAQRDKDSWQEGRALVLTLNMDEIERTVAKRLGIKSGDLIPVI